MNKVTIPPGKYFISHSYKDADVRDAMLKHLPDGVVPYIFPAISVSPLEFVSNTLIGAILACDGMIYLNEGHSEKSFWVAFERDYALRASKNVYGFIPSSGIFYQPGTTPLMLRVFWSAALEDNASVEQIGGFMAQQRYFNLLYPHAVLRSNEQLYRDYRTRDDPAAYWDADAVFNLMRDFIGIKGYLLVYWSKHSLNSRYQQDDLDIAEQLETAFQRKPSPESSRGEMVNRIKANRFRRILFALLDDTPVPYEAALTVQLYGDQERSFLNRIDDLIVMLYWLMYSSQNMSVNL